MATFFNRATLTYGTNSITSNTVSGELVGALTVTKNASIDEYVLGSVLTYGISLVNSGTSAINSLTLSDDLGLFTNSVGVQVRPLTYIDGSILYYQNGVLSPTPAIVTGSPLVLTGISVPAGGSAIIVYNARVNDYAELEVGGEITNTVTIAGTALDDNTATETVTAAQTPLLSILKSLSPESVTENGQLTYTLLIENRGNTEADGALTVSDTFDPILTSITVTYNGIVWTEGTEYTYDESTGEFTTLDGAITVPAASYTTDPTTGEVSVAPGVATIRITGTV